MNRKEIAASNKIAASRTFMKITDVSIFRTQNQNSTVKALANITLENSIAIHGLTVIQSTRDNELYVSMPAVREPEGGYKEIYCHPNNEETRRIISDAVLEVFQSMTENEERKHVTLVNPEDAGTVSFGHVYLTNAEIPTETEDTDNTSASNVVAMASALMNDGFVLRRISICRKDNQKRGLFISMPTRKNRKGEDVDIYHPVTQEARNQLKDAVLAAYAARNC